MNKIKKKQTNFISAQIRILNRKKNIEKQMYLKF